MTYLDTWRAEGEKHRECKGVKKRQSIKIYSKDSGL